MRQLFDSYAEACAARIPGSEYHTCKIHGKWANLPPLDSRTLESSGLGKPTFVHCRRMSGVWKAWRYGQKALIKRPGCGMTAEFNELSKINLGYHVICHKTTDESISDGDPQLAELIKVRKPLSFVDVNDAEAIVQHLSKWHYGTSLYQPKYEPFCDDDLLHEAQVSDRNYVLALHRINTEVWSAKLLFCPDEVEEQP